MPIRVDASEVREFGRNLSARAPAVPAAARRVLAKTAHDIETSAEFLDPVLTGALKASVSSTVGIDTAVIGPTADYGAFQELGTSEMAAQPALGPAFDRQLPQYEAGLAAVLVEALGGRE